ncbi:MAG: hypothetical protein LQ338_007272 [Usnochroma carphineum]|nr:MAG: hypothetical protein LQ338_007272 [Usnochroma carphineum]
MSTPSNLSSTSSTLRVQMIPFDPLLVPRRPAPPPPKRSRLYPLNSEPLLIPCRPAPPPPKRSRLYPLNSPPLLNKRTLFDTERAEIRVIVVERETTHSRKWVERKNPRHLRVNSDIVEKEVEGKFLLIMYR